MRKTYKVIFTEKWKPTRNFIIKIRRHFKSASAYMYRDVAANPISDQNAPWQIKLAGSFRPIQNISLTSK
jgi:hypothetical protein